MNMFKKDPSAPCLWRQYYILTRFYFVSAKFYKFLLLHSPNLFEDVVGTRLSVTRALFSALALLVPDMFSCYKMHNKFLLGIEGKIFICNYKRLYRSFPWEHIMLHRRRKERRSMDRTNELVSAASSFFSLIYITEWSSSSLQFVFRGWNKLWKQDVLLDYHIYPIIQITVILMQDC